MAKINAGNISRKKISIKALASVASYTDGTECPPFTFQLHDRHVALAKTAQQRSQFRHV